MTATAPRDKLTFGNPFQHSGVGVFSPGRWRRGRCLAGDRSSPKRQNGWRASCGGHGVGGFEGDERKREREGERERRKREIRLRAPCPPRSHTLGYIGVLPRPHTLGYTGVCNALSTGPGPWHRRRCLAGGRSRFPETVESDGARHMGGTV